MDNSDMEQQFQAMGLNSVAVRADITTLRKSSRAVCSKRSSNSDCAEFHKFQDFPPEIRLKVWQQAFLSAPAPSKVYRFRVSIVTAKDSRVACFTPFAEVGDLTQQRRNLLRVDKQSRDEALRLSYVDVFLPFNYIDRATNEVTSGIFPFFDLDTVFCLDMDNTAAMQLFDEVLELEPEELFDVVKGFVFNPHCSTRPIYRVLLHAYMHACKNIQKLAIVPKEVYTRQKIKERRLPSQYELDVSGLISVLGWHPEPGRAKFVSWHDWAGGVEQNNVDFLELGDLAFGELEGYHLSATSIFADPFLRIALTDEDPERVLFQELSLDAGPHGPEDEGRSGPVMVVLPAREDLSDLLDPL